MVEGIIIRGISGFYYVRTRDLETIECKARGKFRKDGLSPVVGDRVLVDLTEDKRGYIMNIIPRNTFLYRPCVANVDQAILVFTIKDPVLNQNLLDKLLLLALKNKVNPVLCLNKIDLTDKEEIEKYEEVYNKAGIKVIKTIAKKGFGIDEIKNILTNKITVFAGPSGAGKSTMFNQLQEKVVMKTGEISDRIKRGKHTTRHAELIEMEKETYIVDTPGFSSLDLDFINPFELQEYFKEFYEYSLECRFNSCIHIKEKDCKVREAVDKGLIDRGRYESYIMLYNEIIELNRRY